MTVRQIWILAAAVLAVVGVTVVLVVALTGGSEAGTHRMSDGQMMNGGAGSTHAMPDGTQMHGMDMSR